MRSAALIGRKLQNAETAAWITAVLADGGAVSADRRILVDDLITRLKSESAWTVFDRLPIFAAENTQSALRCIKSAALLTATGSPTFTVDRGYTGTDASSTVYIDSGFNPVSASGNFAQNSAHISTWSLTNAASTASGGSSIGHQTSGGGNSACTILQKFSDNKAYFRINDGNAAASAGVSNADATGHYIANRSGASAQQGYRNAVDQSIVAVSSGALTNANIMIIGNLVAPATHNFGDAHQQAMASIGGSMTSAQAASFYNSLRAYMSAVGVP